MKLLKFSSLVLLAVLFTFCKKSDSDGPKLPEINIIAPTSNQEFTAGDEIAIKISSDVQLDLTSLDAKIGKKPETSSMNLKTIQEISKTFNSEEIQSTQESGNYVYSMSFTTELFHAVGDYLITADYSKEGKSSANVVFKLKAPVAE
ncbi:MAG: hypothetical protein N4A49_00830 [Marinifilaceae bacterium]|jgi:hypothetical protein|nr:hypothetical protein [Marinifilaceae bacterium]